MQVHSIMPRTSGVINGNLKTNSVGRNTHSADNKSVLISFRGDSLHNVRDVLSVSVEDASIGLPMYKCGGAGVVSQQLPEALNSHGGMNVKNAVPYYSFNNPTGGVKVLYIPSKYDINNLPDKMPENLFLSYPADKSLDEIAKIQGCSTDRLRFVLQDEPVSVKNPVTYIDNATKQVKELKESPYRILIPTDVRGTIQRIDENNLDKLKSIPYKVFKIALPAKNAEGQTVYNTDRLLCIHTPDFAKFEKAYTYSPELKNHPHVNLYTRDFGEAAVDSLPKLNSKDIGEFKPANVIGHCRTGFPVTEAVINRSQNNSFYRGFKVIDIFHNPMPNYQGQVGNIFDMLRYKATTEDYLKLTQLPDFPKLAAADAHRYNLSEEESKLADKILKPFLQHYIDDNGNFNHSITPLIARKVNPENISANHVSHTFAQEAVELDDLTRGLTNSFREAANEGDKIPGRPNGCNINGMKINNPEATMGKDNGLSADMKWYTPYDPQVDSGKTIAAAKRKNTEALLNMLGEATESRLDKLSNFTNASVDDALNKLLYSEDLIKKNRYVLGGLSKFHEKDILWAGWGRSDAQKGFPITLEGFYRFLKNESIPEEIRLHAKLFIGSGPEPWPMDDKGCGDFHKIKDIMYKIQNLDGGKYKLNVAYGNGFFPNRLVTCATYSIFTSTGEPQGLSVPEAIQSGTPTGSINTGGAGEMIITKSEDAANVNGFKTKHPYMRNVTDLYPEGTDFSKVKGEFIEQRRFNAAADEVAEMFEDMARTYHEQPREVYEQMAENCGRAKFDWHNNHALNGGRSTLELYTEDAMEVSKGMEGRNKKPLNRLTGEFGGPVEKLKRVVPENVGEAVSNVTEIVTTRVEKGAQKIRNKWTKTIILTGIGIAAAGTAAYAYMKKQHNHETELKTVV